MGVAAQVLGIVPDGLPELLGPVLVDADAAKTT